MRVMLHSIQCLYTGIESWTLSFSYVLLVVVYTVSYTQWGGKEYKIAIKFHGCKRPHPLFALRVQGITYPIQINSQHPNMAHSDTVSLVLANLLLMIRKGGRNSSDFVLV